MLLTILLSALQAAVATAAPPAVTSPSPAVAAASGKCPETMHWADTDRRPGARRLDQLPPGRLELTVLRAMGNCPEPVVLREGIGGNPDSRDVPDRVQPGRR
jgi:hypothetical protein